MKNQPFFYRFILKFLQIITGTFYKIEIVGIENIKQGSAILAANHTSFLDAPIIVCSTDKRVQFLAKKSLFINKFVSAFYKLLDTHPVGGMVTDLDSFKVIFQHLKNNQLVAIFPEGHRSNDGALLRLQPGVAMIAMRCMTPIIPTYIQGTFDIWPRQKKFPKLSGNIKLTFGEPIHPTDFTHLNKKEAQDALMDALEEALIAMSKVDNKPKKDNKKKKCTKKKGSSS